MKTLDCLGLACPAPVLKTKEAIEKEQPSVIKVTVDNEASKQNVTRFLESQKFEVTVEAEGPYFVVTGKRAKNGQTLSEPVEIAHPGDEKKKTMLMVGTDRMGYGDDKLGMKLMVNFMSTLKEMKEELWRLVLVNNGVKLTTEVSEVLPALKDLEEDGVHIMVCGTCLTHFNLLDKKKVGETTNMLDIVTSMQLADKVINL